MQTELLRRNYDYNVSGLPWSSSNTITFPLYSFNHELVGFQQYRPKGDKTIRRDFRNGKYFTYVSPDKVAVWGLESLRFRSDLLVICEGVFKACPFHKFNIPAIAVLGNNPVHLTKQLQLLSLTRKLIVVPDPDKAGMRLTKYGDNYLVPPKPVDDITTAEVKCLIGNLLYKL